MNITAKRELGRQRTADVMVVPATRSNAKRIWTIYKTGRLASQANEGLQITREDVWSHLCGYDTEHTPVYRQIEEWESRIAAPSESGRVLVAKSRADLKVQGVVWPNVAGDKNWLSKLYVARGAQGLGIAGKLVEAALEWHKYQPVHLLVAAYNQKAIRLYQYYGFETVRELQSGYRIAGKAIPQIEMVRDAR